MLTCDQDSLREVQMGIRVRKQKDGKLRQIQTSDSAQAWSSDEETEVKFFWRNKKVKFDRGGK